MPDFLNAFLVVVVCRSADAATWRECYKDAGPFSLQHIQSFLRSMARSATSFLM
jgi:hypothetical protein